MGSFHFALVAATPWLWRSNDKPVEDRTLTPDEHKKYLAYSHIFYGSITALMGLVFGGLCFSMFFLDSRGGPPLFFILIMWTFFTVMFGVMSLPSLLAGFGLLKNRRWARTASIIAAVLAAGQAPVGTAVCVYTFWLLFSEPGKHLFEPALAALPAARQEWSGTPAGQPSAEYAPPTTPPDWR